MQKVLYNCAIGACPVVVYECVVGACPKAEEDNGVVSIFHPNQPEKGKVEMSKDEWNKMITNAKPV